jgi:uncharacterized protein YfaQ (DUF2300 family)
MRSSVQCLHVGEWWTARDVNSIVWDSGLTYKGQRNLVHQAEWRNTWVFKILTNLLQKNNDFTSNNFWWSAQGEYAQ